MSVLPLSFSTIGYFFIKSNNYVQKTLFANSLPALTASKYFLMRSIILSVVFYLLTSLFEQKHTSRSPSNSSMIFLKCLLLSIVSSSELLTNCLSISEIASLLYVILVESRLKLLSINFVTSSSSPSLGSITGLCSSSFCTSRSSFFFIDHSQNSSNNITPLPLPSIFLNSCLGFAIGPTHFSI